MAAALRELPPVINSIVSDENPTSQKLVFATRNQDKLREYQRILGVRVEGKDLKVDEIQDDKPLRVLEEKAKAAYLKNGGPIIVEDTALIIPSIDGLPGAYADPFTNTYAKREALCRMVPEDNRTTIVQIGFAVFDGREVHTRVASVIGEMPLKPRGANGFGFDDIFVPDNQTDREGNSIPKTEWKTNAEMSGEEKDKYSARRLATEQMLAELFVLGRFVFQLQEPSQFQLVAIKVEKLAANPQALRFAYDLTCFKDTTPRSDLSAPPRAPYFMNTYQGGEFKRYATQAQNEAGDLGFITTPIDTVDDLILGNSRLETNGDGEPTFYQMGDGATKQAIAQRAGEFALHHSDEMYQYLRDLQSGVILQIERSNKPSPVIDELLRIRRGKPDPEETEFSDEEIKIIGAAATREAGYAREFSSSEQNMSRTQSGNKGLLLMSTGIPSSLFALGGMPPVTGWSDVLITAALSYMRSWIPRNSIYAENPNLQLRLFTNARDRIQALELPEDIEKIVIGQIGISVGSEDPKGIGMLARRFQNAGCSAIRIYTTNPDKRTIETAEEIRQATSRDMVICMAPIVDVEQARRLIHPNIKTNILLAGHGGGENCTSLSGGGTANSLELLYKMYLDPVFNKTAIGLEGGTGDTFGAFLGMIDVLSLNRRAIAGSIETGGLYAQHVDGTKVQPYHGSASPPTQHIEAAMSQVIADKRLDDSGKLRQVEGKPNYTRKPNSVQSMIDNMKYARMLAGRALADQNSRTIYGLRRNIESNNGFVNHRIVTGEAAFVAADHRGQ